MDDNSRKPFVPGEYIVYQNGDSFEIGKIKRITDDGKAAFVWYHQGCTAARTSFRDMHHIRNAYCITADDFNSLD